MEEVRTFMEEQVRILRTPFAATDIPSDEAEPRNEAGEDVDGLRIPTRAVTAALKTRSLSHSSTPQPSFSHRPLELPGFLNHTIFPLLSYPSVNTRLRVSMQTALGRQSQRAVLEQIDTLLLEAVRFDELPRRLLRRPFCFPALRPCLAL